MTSQVEYSTVRTSCTSGKDEVHAAVISANADSGTADTSKRVKRPDRAIYQPKHRVEAEKSKQYELEPKDLRKETVEKKPAKKLDRDQDHRGDQRKEKVDWGRDEKSSNKAAAPRNRKCPPSNEELARSKDSRCKREPIVPVRDEDKILCKTKARPIDNKLTSGRNTLADKDSSCKRIELNRSKLELRGSVEKASTPPVVLQKERSNEHVGEDWDAEIKKDAGDNAHEGKPERFAANRPSSVEGFTNQSSTIGSKGRRRGTRPLSTASKEPSEVNRNYVRFLPVTNHGLNKELGRDLEKKKSNVKDNEPIAVTGSHRASDDSAQKKEPDMCEFGGSSWPLIVDWSSEVEAQEKLEASGSSEKRRSVKKRRVKKKRDIRKKPETNKGNISRPVMVQKSRADSFSNDGNRSTSPETVSVENPNGIIRLAATNDNEVQNRVFSDDSSVDKGKRQLYEPERPLCIVNPENHFGPRPQMSLMQPQPGQAFQPQQSVFRHTIYHDQQRFIPTDSHDFFDARDGYGMPLQCYGGSAQQSRFAAPSHMMPMHYNQPGIRSLPANMPTEFYTSYKLKSTEKNIHEAMMLVMELSNLLKQTFFLADTSRISQIRFKIQIRYETTILGDMEFCAKHNVEQMLWKAAFYNVIEWYRQHLATETGSDREAICRGYTSLLEEGTVFYENLLEKLQEAYGFHLNDFCDCEALRPPSLARSVKLALISSQKMTICLGDLARYREMINEGTNYGKARSWYYKAQKLAPTNGRPYNQLAVLAVFNRRKFDAVYYYMRSLAASNPFQTAKEGLISIFHDARKKYEETHRALSAVQTPSVQKHRTEETRRRVEVWYTHDGQVVKDGGVAPDDEESDDDGDNTNLSPMELNKMFSLSFLHVHGKLFCRIGFETFNETSQKMVRQFRRLLHMYPLTLSCHRLLQIITINMYAIDNAGLKGSEAFSGSSCESSLKRHALDVSIEMFRLMLERCNDVLQQRLADGYSGPIITEEIQQILPAIKIWCDWFMYHKNVWNPLPSLTDFGLGAEERNVWIEMATFLNLIPKITSKYLCSISEQMLDGYVPVVLPETNTLSGFVPLLVVPQECAYVECHVDKDMARNLCRLSKIRLCGEFLSGITHPVLEWDRLRQGYRPTASTPTEERDQERVRLSSVEKENPEVANDSLVKDADDYDNMSNEFTSCTQVLRTMKQNLEREKAHQDRQALQSQAVLQEASLSPMLYSTVKPKWLVLDTNCFIVYLPKIQSLVTAQMYDLAVPLVVVNELDGLSKSVSRSPTHEMSTADARHGAKVCEEAGRALRYLRECCSARNSRVHALTSMGNLLDKFDIGCETYDDEKSETNDDIILKCCLKLADRNNKETQTKTQEKGDVCYLFWDVVLLTDDRHLRIKALSNDFPVVPITMFMKRMKIG